MDFAIAAAEAVQLLPVKVVLDMQIQPLDFYMP